MFINNDRYTTTTFDPNTSVLPTAITAASEKNRTIQFATNFIDIGTNAFNEEHTIQLSTNLGEVGINAFDEEQIIKKLLGRLAKKPIVEYKCHNCGASVELEVDKHIFICKYCGSVYAVGTNQINSVY